MAVISREVFSILPPLTASPPPHPPFSFFGFGIGKWLPLSVTTVKSSVRLSVDGWWGEHSSNPRREALLGKSIFPKALPGSSGRSGSHGPGCFPRLALGQEASCSLPTFALVSASLGLGLGAEGSRRALCPTSTLGPDL